MNWWVVGWNGCYVAQCKEYFVRFTNHAKARAFAHGKNQGYSDTRAMALANKETNSEG